MFKASSIFLQNNFTYILGLFCCSIKMCLCRFVLVLLESLSGSGHRFAAVRPKLGDKLEKYRFDPWGKYIIYIYIYIYI